MRNNILLSVLLLLTIWACEKKIEQPRTDWGYNYFPLEVGKVWNYEMDSITFRPQIGGVFHDSVHLLVRETLVDTLRDLENKLWYRGERYDRYSDSLPWRFSQTFLLYSDNQRAIRKEDNLEFVKMTFPVEKYRGWDGNVAFDDSRFFEIAGQSMKIYENWSYGYDYTGINEIVHGLSYDSLCLVVNVDTSVREEHEDIEGLATEDVSRQFSIEKYARGVGLVYREMEIMNSDDCPDVFSHPDPRFNQDWCITPWNEKVTAGFIIRQWLVE